MGIMKDTRCAAQAGQAGRPGGAVSLAARGGGRKVQTARGAADIRGRHPSCGAMTWTGHILYSRQAPESTECISYSLTWFRPAARRFKYCHDEDMPGDIFEIYPACTGLPLLPAKLKSVLMPTCTQRSEHH